MAGRANVDATIRLNMMTTKQQKPSSERRLRHLLALCGDERDQYYDALIAARAFVEWPAGQERQRAVLALIDRALTQMGVQSDG